ncbi:hypothetical protein [Mycolicibacterium xanthum]|uniref:hypothetical protein n=1 Tax=Mycolicibacterium xanthum TaxID=2796469 RepID=UPI0021045807|nr:hypothetical protein [Mycolicibacterium xanthum]
MSEATTPPAPEDPSEPATGPVMTGPPAGTLPPQPGPVPPPVPPMPAQPVYATAESNRLNKAAALVGIIAGSVIIVAVIFGTGFFVGKQVGQGPRDDRGHQFVLHPAPPMFPMGPQGEFGRGPEFRGPFGSDGPRIGVPQPPGSQGGSGGQGGPASPQRP